MFNVFPSVNLFSPLIWLLSSLKKQRYFVISCKSRKIHYKSKTKTDLLFKFVYKRKKGSRQKREPFFALPTLEILNFWEDFKKVVEFIEDNFTWLEPMMERMFYLNK